DHLEEAPLFCASSSARRRRSARSSFQRAVSSRTIVTIASILASAERKSATVKAIERERSPATGRGDRQTGARGRQEGLSTAETAESLGISEELVKVHLHR